MVYKYFVSYNYQKGGFIGSGNAEFIFYKEIDDFEEINFMSEEIKEKFEFTDVIIMNYILLSKNEEV